MCNFLLQLSEKISASYIEKRTTYIDLAECIVGNINGTQHQVHSWKY